MKGTSDITRIIGGSAFWAWSVSICVHLILLCAFGFVRFSRASDQSNYIESPIARIESIRQLTQTPPLMPKPRISKSPAVIARNRYALETEQSLPLDKIFTPAQPILQDWQATNTPDGGLPPMAEELSGKIEFFGTNNNDRKVCYLVDCSGSMQGIFSQVRSKLKDSISALQPDQYFCIIFFGDGRLYELGNGQMLRASPKAKSEAVKFVDNMRPNGKTNAVAALERTVRIRDAKGQSPSLVYFLTDGFELTDEDTASVAQRIEKLLERHAPKMAVNTIAFLPQAEDRKMLESIARKTGGTFLSIGGD